jgi:hypothetical protein
MSKITLELEQLENLLNEQRQSCAEYMTRNLSTYHWSNSSNEYNSDKARQEIQEEAKKSPYPKDFQILKKYLSVG